MNSGPLSERYLNIPLFCIQGGDQKLNFSKLKDGRMVADESMSHTHPHCTLLMIPNSLCYPYYTSSPEEICPKVSQVMDVYREGLSVITPFWPPGERI